MATKSISSTKAQNNFGKILDDIVQNNTRYILRRRSSPQALIISLSDFQNLLSNQDERKKVENLLREISPSYELGERVSEDHDG
jgi:PHD/YefM family antitoxin component YafN of YafNO toxin-antitoxin module